MKVTTPFPYEGYRKQEGFYNRKSNYWVRNAIAGYRRSL
ncbi:hypothetical protein SAMN05421659_104241 [[Clostridium] fimetarium]|uniref:Uncharacterized protein n=1 Tax=[Clostridium] fimetarium TaxID=99656 RepID=A0A1I0P8F6_9FIRM|nr:hypothetical protein SAMN05421659_104241 [[Clostridium] fimetarium]